MCFLSPAHTSVSPLTVFQLWSQSKTKTSLYWLLSLQSVPFKEGKETQMNWYPLICKTLRSSGPYKNPWTSKDPWPVLNGVQRDFFLFLSDTKGFGVTTSRTVTAPLKGVDEDTQWSWSSVLIFKHANEAESAEVTFGGILGLLLFIWMYYRCCFCMWWVLCRLERL